MPSEPEVHGLLALILLHDARRHARVNEAGELIPLEEQDRAIWDRAEVAEGLQALRHAVESDEAGPYTIQAAIAAMHAVARTSSDTDWPRVVALYDELLKATPSPVVELNRAVAVAFSEGWESGLLLLEDIAGLEEYHLWHAARADLLRRSGRKAEAKDAYERALGLASNPVERAFLEQRLREAAQA
jgi:RNA polymerase sigma-70 factor (ECF subfamily)